MSDDEIDAVLDTNLRGTLLCARAAIPALRARGGGSIVFASSAQACVTLPGCVPYAAAKAGVVAAAGAQAPEVGRDGIRVNAVAPGTIDTPMLRRDLTGMNRSEVEQFARAWPTRTRSAGSASRARSRTSSSSSPRTRRATSPPTTIVVGGYLSVKTL
jgi:NAD(P)-dependent dehydrogenase (short-subunit alcohol dehydrogenase family)